MTEQTKTFVLAGGCYWCLDAVYRALRGVTDVVSGFAGGVDQDPGSDGQLFKGSGHAETVKVTFDESEIPADVVLDVFFTLHDPTTVDRQGDSVGHEYRSAVFFADQSQRDVFEQAIRRAQEWWPAPIVTEIAPLRTFYPAPEGTQNYFAKNPEAAFCQTVTLPKVVKARKVFADYAREVVPG